MQIKRYITLFEDVTATADMATAISDLSALTNNPLVQQWIEHNVPEYYNDSPQHFMRVIKSMMARLIPYLNEYPPSDPTVDIAQINTERLDRFIKSHIKNATDPRVINWLRNGCYNSLMNVGMKSIFKDIETWDKLVRSLVTYLNQRPPTNPSVSIGNVQQAMDDDANGVKRRGPQIDTNNTAFQNWFGNSVVVTDGGEPMIVYRGQHRPGEPTEFDTKKNIPSFASSPDIASVYAANYGSQQYREGATVGAYYLSIKKPLDLTTTETISLDQLVNDIGADPQTNEEDQRAIVWLVAEIARRWNKGDEFEYELPGDPEGISRLGWDECASVLRDLIADENWVAVDNYLMAFTVDTFVVADCKTLVRWAQAKGFDGIIHSDVFDGGKRIAPVLLGKSANDIDGLDVDGTHLTYRPFYPRQVKAVFNTKWNPNSDHVMEDVWHGSPHKFDSFMTSRIGTGEGNQMYGWGLYFASKRAVALHYQKNIKDIMAKPRRYFLGQELEPDTPEYHAASLLDGTYSLASVRKEVSEWIADATGDEDKERYQKVLDLLNRAGKKSDFTKKGPRQYLYAVHIPDDTQFLLWDKPISDQPGEIINRLHDGGRIQRCLKSHDMTGEELYNAITAKLGSQEKASLALLWMGIHGIKYLDGSSRTKGKGSYNYVVFDDSRVSITGSEYK